MLSRLGFPLLAVILLILSAPARSEESCVAAFCVSSSHAPAAGGQVRIDVAVTPAGKVRNDHCDIRVPCVPTRRGGRWPRGSSRA